MDGSRRSKFRQLGRSRDRLHPTNWRDWSGLPFDILSVIVNKLSCIADYGRFGSVCVSWQQKVSNNIFMMVTQPPQNHKALYNLANNAIYDFESELPPNRDYVGSSFGWLVSTGGNMFSDDRYVRMHNPFYNRTIRLPRLNAKEHMYIKKAVLSCDPSSRSDKFVIMAVTWLPWGASFYRNGDKSWRSITMDLKLLEGTQDSGCRDVLFSRRTKKFYVLLGSGIAVTVEFEGEGETNYILTQVATPLRSNYRAKLYNQSFADYLVEDSSSGDLLHIHSTYSHEGVQFDIFKLDCVMGSWVKMYGIGDSILLLGDLNSMLRAASDCPGYQPNSIYYWRSPKRTNYINFLIKSKYCKVCNLEDGIERPHNTVDSQNLEFSAIWLLPFSS